MTEEDVIFKVYETKIQRQQAELRRMNKDREHLLKVIHKKNLQGMRFVRRRKELQEQIEKMKSDVTEEIGFAKNFDELHTYNVLNNLLNRWELAE